MVNECFYVSKNHKDQFSSAPRGKVCRWVTLQPKPRQRLQKQQNWTCRCDTIDSDCTIERYLYKKWNGITHKWTLDIIVWWAYVINIIFYWLTIDFVLHYFSLVTTRLRLRAASHYTILSLRRPAMAPTTLSPTGHRVVWDPLRFCRLWF